MHARPRVATWADSLALRDRALVCLFLLLFFLRGQTAKTPPTLPPQVSLLLTQSEARKGSCLLFAFYREHMNGHNCHTAMHSGPSSLHNSPGQGSLCCRHKQTDFARSLRKLFWVVQKVCSCLNERASANKSFKCLHNQGTY